MQIRDFSAAQLTALTWWSSRSPYRDRDAVICDGAVRSGKTVCMGLGFFLWAMLHFDGQAFGLCGKTLVSLRRNVTDVLLPLLTELGFGVREQRSEHRLELHWAGHRNSFHLFGGRDEGSASHIQGVTFAGVLLDEVALMPRSRGIGTVDVVFTTGDGVPSAAERAQMQDMLDAEREICVDIRVLAPETETVNVSAALTAAEDRTFAEVSAAAEAALRTYFSGELLGKPVYRARLEALLMAVDGVENCRLTAPAADLPGESVTLPVLGTVSLSEAV